MLLKHDINYKRVKHKEFSSFEHKIVKVVVEKGRSLLLISIYRVLFVPVTMFLEEIVTLFEYLIASKDHVILAGDVNIHMETDELYARKFKDILNTFNITQHIDFPTHIQGHTLDIVATFGDEPIVSDIEANGYDVSHHSLVDFKVAIKPEVKEMKEIRYRKLKNIDADEFMAKVVDRISISESGFGENMRAYNTALRELVDMDAPVTTKTIKIEEELEIRLTKTFLSIIERKQQSLHTRKNVNTMERNWKEITKGYTQL